MGRTSRGQQDRWIRLGPLRDALPASIFVLSGLPVSALREDHIGAYLGSPLPYQRPGWRLVAGLMAIEAKLDEATRTVALSHPDRPDVTIQPDENPAAFLEWVHPLMPNDRAASAQILAAPDRGMTDTDFPSISLINLSSHRAVAQKIGRDISPKRWRGNFWIEGLAPWEEFEWIGREMRIGSARVVLRDRIVRCMATTASPSTGKRDVDTLAALDAGWGHQDFGVYAEVTQSGTVVQGDRLVLI